jgi:hypothetical protein
LLVKIVDLISYEYLLLVYLFKVDKSFQQNFINFKFWTVIHLKRIINVNKSRDHGRKNH